MANFKLRAQAIQLRLEGYTYGQIKRELNLSKSTLSDWLKDLQLTEEQLKKLNKSKLVSRDIAIERFRETFRNKRLTRLQKILKEQISATLPLTEKELFIAGLFLYWGEGSKQHGQVLISNTNPKVIQFAFYWMINALKVPKEKIKIALHLYKDMDVKKEMSYWSTSLGIPLDQFRGPYFKKTNREGLTYKSFGHGTCNIFVSRTVLSEMIAMSIKAISDFYGEKSDLFWYN